MEQGEELSFQFDAVMVCRVTGSTQAGIVAGVAHTDRAQRVIGIDDSTTVEITRDQATHIAR
jgi:1-aminocyclopropane-1-carboxylate deaminase